MFPCSLLAQEIGVINGQVDITSGPGSGTSDFFLHGLGSTSSFMLGNHGARHGE